MHTVHGHTKNHTITPYIPSISQTNVLDRILRVGTHVLLSLYKRREIKETYDSLCIPSVDTPKNHTITPYIPSISPTNILDRILRVGTHVLLSLYKRREIKEPYDSLCIPSMDKPNTSSHKKRSPPQKRESFPIYIPTHPSSMSMVSSVDSSMPSMDRHSSGWWTPP